MKKKRLKLKPLRDLLVLKRVEVEDSTNGGIYLPEKSRDRPQEGVVLAVGEGRVLNTGKLLKIAVSVGDTVIYPQFGGTDIRVDGEDFMIIDEFSLLAVKEK